MGKQSTPLAPPARIRFAGRLKSKRRERGYKTAREFSAAIGIDENRYTRYERAETEPDISLLLRICNILDISVDEILGSKDNNVQENKEILRRLRSEKYKIKSLDVGTVQFVKSVLDFMIEKRNINDLIRIFENVPSDYYSRNEDKASLYNKNKK